MALGFLDCTFWDALQQALRFSPRFAFGIAADQVDADPEAQLSAMLGRLRTQRCDARLHHRRSLAPSQVDVGVFGGDALGRGRCASEVNGGGALEWLDEPAVFDPIVLALEIEAAASPNSAHDAQKLVGSLVARVVVQEVSVGLLLGGAAAGDDVQQ